MADCLLCHAASIAEQRQVVLYGEREAGQGSGRTTGTARAAGTMCLSGLMEDPDMIDLTADDDAELKRMRAKVSIRVARGE
ncbi:hypothetical protein J3R83DRAFT_5516 [Lanmaoa asiatica]|nr:hypothetical protein J3R83DRAFT_5516 [Lanmaoa asiatica]